MRGPEYGGRSGNRLCINEQTPNFSSAGKTLQPGSRKKCGNSLEDHKLGLKQKSRAKCNIQSANRWPKIDWMFGKFLKQLIANRKIFHQSESTSCRRCHHLRWFWSFSWQTSCRNVFSLLSMRVRYLFVGRCAINVSIVVNSWSASDCRGKTASGC